MSDVVRRVAREFGKEVHNLFGKSPMCFEPKWDKVVSPFVCVEEVLVVFDVAPRLQGGIEDDVGFLLLFGFHEGETNVLRCCDCLFPCKRDEAMLQHIMALQFRCVAVHGMFQAHRGMTRAVLWQSRRRRAGGVLKHEDSVVV